MFLENKKLFTKLNLQLLRLIPNIQHFILVY